jgi:tellurite resistance protein TehA-like permease
VVATQSLATAGAMIALHEPLLSDGMAVVAAAAWAAGCILYLVLISILMARLLLFDVSPEDIEPNYWVLMGATAISVLAGARILNLPHAIPIVGALVPTASGIAFMLWAFGTWLVPILLALGVWRHLIHRTPLRYDVGLWTVVFPLGMYSSASAELGGAEHLPFMAVAGGIAAYVALFAWLSVAVGWALQLRRWLLNAQPSRLLA